VRTSMTAPQSCFYVAPAGGSGCFSIVSRAQALPLPLPEAWSGPFHSRAEAGSCMSRKVESHCLRAQDVARGCLNPGAADTKDGGLTEAERARDARRRRAKLQREEFLRKHRAKQSQSQLQPPPPPPRPAPEGRTADTGRGQGLGGVPRQVARVGAPGPIAGTAVVGNISSGTLSGGSNSNSNSSRKITAAECTCARALFGACGCPPEVSALRMIVDAVAAPGAARHGGSTRNNGSGAAAMAAAAGSSAPRNSSTDHTSTATQGRSAEEVAASESKAARFIVRAEAVAAEACVLSCAEPLHEPRLRRLL
jgi:hypothetical protein